MNNQKSFRSSAILCSIVLVLGGSSLSSALAKPVVPDTNAPSGEPAPALSDAELDSLARGSSAGMRTVVSYLNVRMRNFISHAQQIPKRTGGTAEFHYRKMMTELMRTYDVLQASKPYIESSKFVEYSKEWRALQSQVVLSQQMFLIQPTVSSQALSGAVQRAKRMESQLKAVDRLL